MTARRRHLHQRRSALLVATAVLSGLAVVPPMPAEADEVTSTMSGSPLARPSVTINRPPSGAPGRVMVASVVVNDETTTLTAPGGWSLVRDDAIPGALRQSVYLRVAGPDEPPSYTWKLSDPGHVTGGITAYPGIAATNPIDTHAATLQPESAPTIAAPALTTSVPQTRLVLLTATTSEGNLVAGPGLTKRWQIAARDPDAERDPVASAADASMTAAGPAPAFSTRATRPGPAISALLALRPAGTAVPPDTDPPATRIKAGPPTTVTASVATFVFSADEPASFTCALDGAAPVSCSSPTTYTGVTPGPHRLSIVATDAAGNADPAPVTRQWTVNEANSGAPVLVGAGDIADCDSQGDEITAGLIENIPGTVFTVGDNAYLNGTAKEFADCYDPTWGRFKDRTMPAPGNHEYHKDPKAKGYYQYFGDAAGDPEKGYYDYTLGSWHVIVLNSVCFRVGGCGPGSPQEQWLREVLAASKARCTVAITHHARFSSAKEHGSNPIIQPLWQALYDHGVDVVLSGHDHVYERFGPQTPSGKSDPLFGLRQFTVGMGGRDHRRFGTTQPNSEVRDATTFGVLKLTLHPSGYDWQFVGEPGKPFTDQGTADCHDAPEPSPVPPLPPLPPGPITAVGTSSSGAAEPRAAVTLQRPSGTGPGTVMVASVAAAGSAAEFVAPDGWDLVREDAIDATLHQAVYVKMAGDDEPRSYTWALSSAQLAAGGITTYSGVDVTDPFGAQAGSVSAADSTTAMAPPLTTTVPDALVVHLMAANVGGTVHGPAGMKERWETRAREPQSGSGLVMGSADAREPVSGPSGPWRAALPKPGRSIVAMLALQPAPYSPPPPPRPPPTTDTPAPSTTVPTS
jgi:hypothetical protein